MNNQNSSSINLTTEKIKEITENCRDLTASDTPEIYVMTTVAYDKLKSELLKLHEKPNASPLHCTPSTEIQDSNVFGVRIEHYKTLKEVHLRCIELRQEGKRVALVSD